MELRHLRYFLAVAKEQSFTTAAKTACVSQPALSKQIKDLEDEVGKPLFVRGTKKVQLTDAGLFLKMRAENILELAQKTLDDLKADDTDISGEISLVCGEIDSISEIAKAIKEMNRRYPAVKFNLTTGDEATVRYQLDRGLADFGIFVGLPIISSYDYIQISHLAPWGLLTQKDESLEKKNFVSPKDLLNRPVMVSRQMLENNVLSDWLGFSTKKMNIIGTSDMLYNASKLAEAGVAGVIGIDGIINTNGTNLKFYPLKPAIPIKVAFAWKKQKMFSKACEKFLEILNG